ncbi:MAG: glycosyltransferase family 87 protein [Chloroflexota bacterium]
MTRYFIFLLGFLSLIPYGIAWRLGDLRQNTVGFLVVFLAAFALYAVATILAMRIKTFTHRDLIMTFVLAMGMQGFLIFTPPTLSDDMYRYVWNGRIQTHGISPYQYPPNSPELAHLRDAAIYPHINRKASVTIYPPAAETAYAVLWRIWPDSVRWFQIAMAAGGLLAGILLLKVLAQLHLSPARVLIYLWSPLLHFETAHAAHVDGLILPLLVGAWWARLRERDSLVGILLGLATAVKLYPIILLPSLWRSQERQGRWQMPLAFTLTLTICYAPAVLDNGIGVIGYLPDYLHESFNRGVPAGSLYLLFTRLGIDSNLGVLLVMLLTLSLIAFIQVWQPATDGVTAVRRCLWPMAAFTLLTQNLCAWYLLWLLPLIALFLQPGLNRTQFAPVLSEKSLSGIQHLKLRLITISKSNIHIDAWSGWWLFSGLIALSYSYFIYGRPILWLAALQFLPLYLFLLLDLARYLTDTPQLGESSYSL